MDRNKLLKDFEILEIPPDASMPEVRKAYLFLRELYSTDSIASIPISWEISEKERETVLDQIESAYRRIRAGLGKDNPSPEQASPPPKPVASTEKNLDAVDEFTGAALRQFRKDLDLDLYDVVRATRIQVHHLEAIESENYEALPPDVYTRGFVASYAKYLALDPDRVTGDFMKKYKEWKESTKKRRSSGLLFRRSGKK